MTGFKVASFGSTAKASTMVMDSDILNPFGYGFKGTGFRILNTIGNPILLMDDTFLAIPGKTKMGNVIVDNNTVYTAGITKLKQIKASDTLLHTFSLPPVADRATEEIEILRFCFENIIPTSTTQDFRIVFSSKQAYPIGCACRFFFYRNDTQIGTCCTSVQNGVSVVYTVDSVIEPGDVFKITYTKTVDASRTVTIDYVKICGDIVDVPTENNYPITVIKL